MKWIGLPFRTFFALFMCSICYVPGGLVMLVFSGRVDPEFVFDFKTMWDWVLNPELYG